MKFIKCDICEVIINGQLSVYVRNELAMNPEGVMGTRQVESHYCQTCTEKIKELLNKFKYDSGRPNTNS